MHRTSSVRNRAQERLAPSQRGSSESSEDRAEPDLLRQSRREKCESGARPAQVEVAEVTERPVTPGDVLTLAGVALSWPVRAALGVGLVPLGLTFALGTSLVRGVRGQVRPDTSGFTWAAGGQNAEKADAHDIRVVVPGAEFDDWNGSTARAVKVRHTVHTVDLTVDRNAWSDKKLDGDTFSGLTLKSRLDFVAHGTSKYCDNFSATEIADRLAQGGLRRVGVIKFHSCHAGSKHFLEELGQRLAERGIEFGWLSGGVGLMGDLRVPARLGRHTYTWSPVIMPWHRVSGLYAPEALTRRVLKGNAAVDFKGTVYDSHRPSWRIASDFSPLH